MFPHRGNTPSFIFRYWKIKFAPSARREKVKLYSPASIPGPCGSPGAWVSWALGPWNPGRMLAPEAESLQDSKISRPPKRPSTPEFQAHTFMRVCEPIVFVGGGRSHKVFKNELFVRNGQQKTICWHLFAIFMKYISTSIARKLCGMVLPRLGVITIRSYYFKDRKLNISWFPNLWAPGDPYEWNWTCQLVSK